MYLVNDRAYIASGFGFMRCNVVANPGLPVGFYVQPGLMWSEGALGAYANIREQVEAMVSVAITVGFTGVCIEDGVALAVRPGDPRPQWSILEEAAVDLFTAQAIRLMPESVK